MKKYKAIFFDWDGTAVLSRHASANNVIEYMRPLLDNGTKLIIISGTTYENIDGGKIHTRFTTAQLNNLYLGLGRGAFNYAFDEQGEPYIFSHCIPDIDKLLKIHKTCFNLHCKLLKEYGIYTDIIFSRPNYCKIDLIPNVSRGESQFLQGNEIILLNNMLEKYKFAGGVDRLIKMAQKCRYDSIKLSVTTDAKYLEIGVTGKNDNVDIILSLLLDSESIRPEQCCFWGDEFVGISDKIFGSDSNMITPTSKKADFFDVSDINGKRPPSVKRVGGGVSTFVHFLSEQAVSDN